MIWVFPFEPPGSWEIHSAGIANDVPVVSARLEKEVVSSTANWFEARDTAAPRS